MAGGLWDKRNKPKAGNTGVQEDRKREQEESASESDTVKLSLKKNPNSSKQIKTDSSKGPKHELVFSVYPRSWPC